MLAAFCSNAHNSEFVYIPFAQQAESYTRGAGLGSMPSGSGFGAGDGSYKERLQNLTRARWEEDHNV